MRVVLLFRQLRSGGQGAAMGKRRRYVQLEWGPDGEQGKQAAVRPATSTPTHHPNLRPMPSVSATDRPNRMEHLLADGQSIQWPILGGGVN